MDPFSIIGGIAAIGQAAEVVATCASALYQISCKASTLEEEIDFFASNVHVFGSTVSHAHRTIRDHYINHNTSKTIRKLNESSVLDSLAFQCKCVTRRVDNLQERVNGYNRGPDIVARFLWLLNKEKRNDIYLTMETIKMSFLLVMSQITYEILKRRVSNPSALERKLCDFEKEMKECKNVIKLHMRAMNVFKNRLESPSYHSFPRDSDEDQKVEIDQVESVLLDIGSDIIHRDQKKTSRRATTRALRRASTIPNTTDGFSSNANISRKATRRASRQASIIPNTTDGFSSNENIGGEKEGYIDAENIVQTKDPTMRQFPLQASPNESLSHMTDQSSDIHSLSVRRNHQSPLTPKLSESSPSSIVSSSILSQGSPKPDRAMLQDEGDYIGVQASDRVLHLDPNLNYEVAEGYINSYTNPTYAILNSGFPQNIITEVYAAELGLKILYSERDDGDDIGAEGRNEDIESEINFGDSDVHSVIGRTTFLWSISQQGGHLRPLRVTCLVSRSIPFQTPLVFGQRYIDRRMYYWHR